MKTTAHLWQIAFLALMLGACYPRAHELEPDSSRGDTYSPGADLGPTSDADAGLAGDVAIYNDGSPLKPDTHVAADMCVAPASCSVLFSYPKGGESKVELFGDFNSWKTGLPMTLSGSTWSVATTLTHGAKVLYKFVLDGKTWVPDPNNPNQTTDGNKNSILAVSCPGLCGDAGVSPDGGGSPDAGPAPDGGGAAAFDWRDGIMYFVLLDRFSDGDSANNKAETGVKTPANFQGGDLQGLLNKIKAGYFTSLGVNVIWISSPVDAPDGKYKGTDGEYYTGYHGYWPTDLTKVEERLGTLGLLKSVVAAAHKKGIRVVMDYVMNHVHSTSPTYKTSASWFWSLTYYGKTCVCGQGCSWETVPERLRCWFTDYLPDFDFTNSAARKFSVDNAIAWIKSSGVDGYRLDAVKHIDISWLTDLRKQVNAQIATGSQPFYMVGETFTNSKSLLKTYIDPATKLDGQFDFPFRAELVKVILMRQGTFHDLHNFLNANDGYYGSGAIMGTFIGNHDLPRSIHLAEDSPQFGQWDSGKSKAWYNLPAQPGGAKPYERLEVAFTALMTLPGIPLIYYGDEIGLAGGGDPDNRRMMTWSGASTYQQGVKSHLSKLAKIRKAHPALSRGKRQQHWVASDIYAYSMTHGSDKVYVVLNRSDVQKTIFLPGTSYTDLLTGAAVSAKSINIPARTSLVLE